MIRRLLIVLSIAGGIVFVPYLAGKITREIILPTIYMDDTLAQAMAMWLKGTLIIGMAAGISLILYILIKYIIKGD